MTTITTKNSGHWYETGDFLEITTLDQRKWKRFLHWITFRKPPIKTDVVKIIAISETTLTF